MNNTNQPTNNKQLKETNPKHNINDNKYKSLLIKISLVIFNFLTIIAMLLSLIFIVPDLYYKFTCYQVDATITSYTQSETVPYEHGNNKNSKYNRLFKGQISYTINDVDYNMLFQRSELLDENSAPYTIGDIIPIYISKTYQNKYFFHDSYIIYYMLFLSLLGLFLLTNLFYKKKQFDKQKKKSSKKINTSNNTKHNK